MVSEEKYDGATVPSPSAWFYDVPIFTLDFASSYRPRDGAQPLLHPWLSPAAAAKLKPDQYIKRPTAICL